MWLSSCAQSQCQHYCSKMFSGLGQWPAWACLTGASPFQFSRHECCEQSAALFIMSARCIHLQYVPSSVCFTRKAKKLVVLNPHCLCYRARTFITMLLAYRLLRRLSQAHLLLHGLVLPVVISGQLGRAVASLC